MLASSVPKYKDRQGGLDGAQVDASDLAGVSVSPLIFRGATRVKVPLPRGKDRLRATLAWTVLRGGASRTVFNGPDACASSHIKHALRAAEKLGAGAQLTAQGQDPDVVLHICQDSVSHPRSLIDMRLVPTKAVVLGIVVGKGVFWRAPSERAPQQELQTESALTARAQAVVGPSVLDLVTVGAGSDRRQGAARLSNALAACSSHCGRFRHDVEGSGDGRVPFQTRSRDPPEEGRDPPQAPATEVS